MRLASLRPFFLTALAWIASSLYAVSPADLLPDILPVFGWVDDAVGLGLAALLTLHTARRRARLHSAPTTPSP